MVFPLIESPKEHVFLNFRWEPGSSYRLSINNIDLKFPNTRYNCTIKIPNNLFDKEGVRLPIIGKLTNTYGKVVREQTSANLKATFYQVRDLYIEAFVGNKNETKCVYLSVPHQLKNGKQYTIVLRSNGEILEARIIRDRTFKMPHEVERIPSAHNEKIISTEMPILNEKETDKDSCEFSHLISPTMLPMLGVKVAEFAKKYCLPADKLVGKIGIVIIDIIQKEIKNIPTSSIHELKTRIVDLNNSKHNKTNTELDRTRYKLCYEYISVPILIKIMKSTFKSLFLHSSYHQKKYEIESMSISFAEFCIHQFDD